MKRTHKPTDFVLPIPGIGDFTFAKRTLGDDLAINREICRVAQGVQLDGIASLYTEAFATLKVLTVEAPKGWNPDELENQDSLDPEAYESLLKVWELLRKKEEDFRPKREAEPGPREGGGEGVI